MSVAPQAPPTPRAQQGARPLKGARLIGLTGGIACGKSAVARMLSARGARVIDADQVARAVVEPGSEGLKAIVARWGEGVLTAEGALNRPALGALIFSEPEGRAALEGILHPLIAQESARRIQEALQEAHQEALSSPSPTLVVYDAALLIEAGRADEFRPLVVVYASPEAQLSRVMERDSLSREEAEARLKAQLPAIDKCAHADWVIINEGSLEGLEAEVEALLAQLSQL